MHQRTIDGISYDPIQPNPDSTAITLKIRIRESTRQLLDKILIRLGKTSPDEIYEPDGDNHHLYLPTTLYGDLGSTRVLARLDDLIARVHARLCEIIDNLQPKKQAQITSRSHKSAHRPGRRSYHRNYRPATG